MNLITSRRLDRSESQVIYELTLKKRQSKKSTMSEKHLAAKQQLARELMLQRIIPIEDSLLAHNLLLSDSNSIQTNTTNITPSSSSPSIATTNATNDDQSSNFVDLDQPSTSGSIETMVSSATSSGCCPSYASSTASSSSSSSSSSSLLNQINTQTKQKQHNHMSSPACSSCGSSFGRSDSSYSASSQASSGSARMMIIKELVRRKEEEYDEDEDEDEEDNLQGVKKEANIKYNKTRLEQLNEELERKLYQYEYLVTKEKALLGAYNMLLFTNEGVNNFYS